MDRIARMFEIIQMLRAANAPLRADDIAASLEVSTRTVYRDISALQAMRTPIEGAAGVGYLMRRGYDLPALNFDREEVEALRVGLRMVTRSGDSALRKAAARVSEKIDALQDDEAWIQVAPWGAPSDDESAERVSLATVRAAIRGARKLCILYRDAERAETERIIRPVGIVYHIEAVLIAGWCEMRSGFRHFRADRIRRCELQEETFLEQAETLRALWLEQERYHEEYG